MKIVNGKIVEATRAELSDYFMKHVDAGDSFGAFVCRCIKNGTKIVIPAKVFRQSLPNPPFRKLNHVTRKLEDATRMFLNDLSYCVAARSRDMVECKDWMREMSDQLCALRAHYNRIFDNRNAKGGAK